MVRLKILNSYYKIIGDYDIQESSREVQFSSLKIDFTNKTINDLPLKYQEVQLVNLNDDYTIKELIYTGYVNNFTLPKMKNRREFRELELDLLSPLAMATVRTASAIGTYNLQSLITELLQPLISDGFELKEMNVGNNQITVNFLTETIESSLNKLSNKFNFWWFIDKNKNIYINDISSLILRPPKLIYDDNNPLKGLIDIIPSIDATDYCNVVNFTNLRMFTHSRIFRNDDGTFRMYNPITQVTELRKGDEIEFDVPFDITISNYLKVKDEFFTGVIYDALFWLKYYTNDPETTSDISIEVQNEQLVLSNNVSIDDFYSEKSTFVFVRDNFFKNLIVGMKYNGNPTIKISQLSCINALIWTKLQVIDNDEVYKNKGIISETGIVEKQINMNEQWKFYDEIINIANSYIGKNVPRAEQIELNMDKDYGLEIGDTIEIKKDDFLVNDSYIITDKKIMYSKNVTLWRFILKNANILESYVDLFRMNEQEETDEKNYYLITSNYSEDTIKETYEVNEL